MENSSFADLVNKYLTDSISVKEEQELFERMALAENQAILSRIIDERMMEGAYLDTDQRIKEAHLREIGFQGLEAKIREYEAGAAIAGTVDALSAGVPSGRIIKNRRWLRFAAAAVLIGLICTGGFFLLISRSHRESDLPPGNPISQQDIAPGGNKAILTLAGGSNIILDSAANGTLVRQGNVDIVKLSNGQLAYKSKGENDATALYNTLSTPRGGQYRLTLPDGSRVWLNAASSIRYPTAFSGKERRVELTGEAYFEIAKNAAMPFAVSKGGVAITVLGTNFNVNAYPDEATMKVTLLEGSVRVTQGGAADLLQAGQQARIGKDIQVTGKVDVDEVMAWKNGKFIFGDRTDIATIMRQVARWYDVEVEYQGTVTQHFWGTISRDVNVSRIFRMLEATGGVHFKIGGKKVTVMP